MRWKLITWLTIQATNLSNILLHKREWQYNLNDLKQMPANSLGYNLQHYYLQTGIVYKPNLIRHDLKHILLNYKMKMPDELKIHAFLIGNKSYNPMGIVYLCICILIVPEILPALKKEYKRGQKATCLKNIQLQNYVMLDVNFLRTTLNIR